MNPIRFFKNNWKELLFALALLALVRWSANVIHRLEPTAGTTDFGAVDVFVYGAGGVVAALFFVWIVLDVFFPTVSRYLDTKQWKEDWFVASAEFRVKWTLLLILGLIALVVWSARTFAGA